MKGSYSSEDPIPLPFQTGYLTIAQVRHNRYRLRIPNGEVRSALVEDLMPRYMGITRESFSNKISDLLDCLK